MPRLLFEKTGNAVWMSHLDLMRLFQRAFKRANLPLKHTQGFNPRPSVSIALPLSVGVESQCELLDFELVDCNATALEIKERLNAALVDGVTVLDVYENGKKTGLISLLRCQITLSYDSSVPAGACDAIDSLFAGKEVIVTKKTKSGMQDQNIIPMIRSMGVKQAGESDVVLDAVICCQNPTLNPAQITTAIDLYLPEMKPNFSQYRRIEIYDHNEAIFR
jgi:radical SAM-linked protein